MQGLRIALVVPGIPHCSGGPSVAVAALAARLCDAGHEVSIVTADLVPYGGPPGPMVEVDKRVRMQLFPVRSRWDRRMYRSVEMRHWLQRAVRTFDVVDIQGVWSFIAVDTTRACLHAGIPYVLTPRGQMARWDWAQNPWQKRAFFALFLQKVWRSAAVIRFLSEGEARQSMVGEGTRGVVIPNPVSLPVERDARHYTDGFRGEVRIPSDAPVILFLGRVTAQKGVLELVEAFDQLWRRRRDAVLLLVGPLDGAYGAAVAARVNRLSSRANIHMLGPLYDERKYGVLATASLFATLSKNEGLPIAALEAMAWGLPVVLTDQSNLPEVSEYNAGATVALSHSGALTDTLERLLGDPAQLKEMGKNARRLIEERFTWEKVLPQLLSVYERVVRGNSAAPPAVLNGAHEYGA